MDSTGAGLALSLFSVSKRVDSHSVRFPLVTPVLRCNGQRFVESSSGVGNTQDTVFYPKTGIEGISMSSYYFMYVCRI